MELTNTQYTIKDFLEVKASFAAGFNPNASKIVYMNNDTGTAQLYAVPREGGERIQLTDFPDSFPRPDCGEAARPDAFWRFAH